MAFLNLCVFFFFLFHYLLFLFPFSFSFFSFSFSFFFFLFLFFFSFFFFLFLFFFFYIFFFFLSLFEFFRKGRITIPPVRFFWSETNCFFLVQIKLEKNILFFVSRQEREKENERQQDKNNKNIRKMSLYEGSTTPSKKNWTEGVEEALYIKGSFFFLQFSSTSSRDHHSYLPSPPLSHFSFPPLPPFSLSIRANINNNILHHILLAIVEVGRFSMKKVFWGYYVGFLLFFSFLFFSFLFFSFLFFSFLFFSWHYFWYLWGFLGMCVSPDVTLTSCFLFFFSFY